MHSFILIDPQENRCFDFVEHESSASPFPVAYPLIWVDVTNEPIKPQHGWSATFNDGAWLFTLFDE